MGRHRSRLVLLPAQILKLQKLLQTTRDPRVKERLQFALRAASGRYTLEDLARQAGRSRSTIQNWQQKLGLGGLARLLERDTPPGMVSPLASRTVQAQFKAGLRSERWRSASEIAAWLKQDHGIERSRKSIYYWIRKLDADGSVRKSKAAKPVPRGRK